MSRVIVDFSTPGAGFDQPLELWQACHERVRRMTGLLQRLFDHLARAGVDSDARTTATSIRRYFDEAAPRHHDDEEVDLFPILRSRLDRLDAVQAAQVTKALATLETDHTELGAMWNSLRVPLEQFEQGRQATLDEATVALFVSRYRAHMEIEETIIEPALKRLLTKRDIAAIGRSMAHRRGVEWSELTSSK